MDDKLFKNEPNIKKIVCTNRILYKLFISFLSSDFVNFIESPKALEFGKLTALKVKFLQNNKKNKDEFGTPWIFESDRKTEKQI